MINPSALTNAVTFNARDQLLTSIQNVKVGGITYPLSQAHQYDNGGRLSKVKITFAGLTRTVEETTAFNALDKATQVKIGGGLQTVDYSYFVGGFLDKINGGTTNTGGLSPISNGWPSENSKQDLFAMDLDYLANGNISNWKQQNRGFALQNYAYTYDALQRITTAIKGTQSQSYNYKDVLGNFNALSRNDLVKNSGVWGLQNIHDLTYSYFNPLSSQIQSVADTAGHTKGYKPNSGTYAYDANDNTTYDPANKIATVYNYLNLPSQFTKDEGGSL